MGASGAMGVRLCAGGGGSEVTMSGSSRVFSAWSVAATTSREVVISRGLEKTRLARVLHSGQAHDSGAVPSGRVVSNTPCWSHRYS